MPFRPAVAGEGADRRARLPTWAALAGILVVTGLVSSWNIGDVGLSPYYAAAAKSMAASPRAFAVGALDPAASITLDKLSGFLVPQALSVAVFGFHAWSLSLPQVLEGLATVFTGYLIGARWRGRRYGLAVAGLLAITPMLPAMFGRPSEDAMLTLCQVLAFAAAQQAIRMQRARWLAASALWIAVGFQAKMLQSWLLLPAVALMFLLGSRAPLRRRLLQLAAALLLCVVISVAWMTAVQLLPAGMRPFVDGTTDDDMYSMVFGYDGFDRLVHGVVPGAVPQLNQLAGAGSAVVNRTRTGAAAGSWLKLLLPPFVTQIGWLLPLSAAGVAFAGAGSVRHLRTRSSHDRPGVRADGPLLPPARATELGLAAWLVTVVLVLSPAFVPHATYFGVIALPLAAFAVHAADRALAAYRSDAWGILPVLVVVQAVWAAAVIAVAVAQLRPMAAGVLTTGLAAAAALLIARARGSVRVRGIGLVAAVAVALLAPSLWTAFTIGSGGGGSASDPYAGPPIGASSTVPLLGIGGRDALIELHRPFGIPPDGRVSAADGRLLRFVDARNRAGAIPFASDSLPAVVDVLLWSRASPLPMGGYSGRAPEPGLRTVQGLVQTGRLRYVLLEDTRDRAHSSPTLSSVRRWIDAGCRSVLRGRFGGRSKQDDTLFDCRATRA